MSVFHDSANVYSLDWDSSPWKPYFNKPTSRYLDKDSGDNVKIKVWCAEEDLEGKTFTLDVKGNSGTDYLTSVSYNGGAYAETDDFGVNYDVAHDDRTVKWWYGPGVALQFPDGLHWVNTYTSASTLYTHTILASDIGERVYDGGIHCWMKLPHAPQDGGSTPATETDIYSKNIPMEFINSHDFLFVFNSFGHVPIAMGAGNKGLSIQVQYSDVLNAGDGQFVNDDVLLFDDIDPSSFLADVNASYMTVGTVTGSGAFKRKNAKSIRFYWYTEDQAGTEATWHGGQFIRISLYPIKR